MKGISNEATEGCEKGHIWRTMDKLTFLNYRIAFNKNKK